jgi:hypothetical protein
MRRGLLGDGRSFAIPHTARCIAQEPEGACASVAALKVDDNAAWEADP